MATIDATPFPHQLDIDRVALVRIDTQPEFCLPRGFAESLGDDIANLALVARNGIVGRTCKSDQVLRLPESL